MKKSEEVFSQDYNYQNGFKQFFKGLWIILVLIGKGLWRFTLWFGKFANNYAKNQYKKMK